MKILNLLSVGDLGTFVTNIYEVLNSIENMKMILENTKIRKSR